MVPSINVKVVQFNGEDILEKVELQPSEKVSTLIDKVKHALGHAPGVDLIGTNGDKLLKDLSIEESGLQDGETITALLKPPIVPTVLKFNPGGGGMSAELKIDGSVEFINVPDDPNPSSHVPVPFSKVQSQLVDVQSIYKTDGIHLRSTHGAFAALKADGGVVAWGHRAGNPGSVQSQLVDVVGICSTEAAFAAIKADGSIVSWGDYSDPPTRLGDDGVVMSDGRIHKWGAPDTVKDPHTKIGMPKKVEELALKLKAEGKLK